MSAVIIHNLMIILIAGLVSGIISKRIGIPMVIGYLLAGAIVGEGCLDLFSHGEFLQDKNNKTRIVVKEAIQENLRTTSLENLKRITDHSESKTGAESDQPRMEDADRSSDGAAPTSTGKTPTGDSTDNGTSPENAISVDEAASEFLTAVTESEEFQKETINQLADLGALFLLFSIGVHFAPSQLLKIKKFLLVGGPLQMFGVIIPLTLISYWLSGDWRFGLMLGFAVSLSSTVLVFKSLEDFGQASSAYGTRAVSILLFQDIATAPILLIIPLLNSEGVGDQSLWQTFLMMGAKALFFVVLIVGIRLLFTKRGITLFSQLRSVEIMVLFTIVLIFAVCLIAEKLELPSAIGAFAAGVAMSENRLSGQISALSIPFRETFSAIFFVSLGALFDPQIVIQYPSSTLLLLVGFILLKTIAGGIAFKLLGLAALPSIAMGLGISQLGELSFIILQQGNFQERSPVFYQQILFVALSSIILTPAFLKLAMNIVRKRPIVENPNGKRREMLIPQGEGKRTAIVIGMGPIGQRVTSFLELFGVDVCLMDMNPLNLQPYAQEGFRTIAGDATELIALKHAQIENAKLVVITIPDDHFATEVINVIRRQGIDCSIVVRCRYTASILLLKQAGADIVICEETEAGGRLVQTLEPLI